MGARTSYDTETFCNFLTSALLSSLTKLYFLLLWACNSNRWRDNEGHLCWSLINASARPQVDRSRGCCVCAIPAPGMCFTLRMPLLRINPEYYQTWLGTLGLKCTRVLLYMCFMGKRASILRFKRCSEMRESESKSSLPRKQRPRPFFYPPAGIRCDGGWCSWLPYFWGVTFLSLDSFSFLFHFIFPYLPLPSSSSNGRHMI